MIAQSFDYAAPATLAEALELLAEPGAKVLAGGMSLIPMMKLRLAAPEKLVDLRHIPGLREIREFDHQLEVGAMVTHYEIESSNVVRLRCPLLSTVAGFIGDVQIRNAGTIGGSVAHADPAADYPAALQALEAQIVVIGPAGERVIPCADFFVDTLATALEPGEIVTAIRLPLEAVAEGVSYQKCVQPASGFAIVGVAARLMREAGKVSRVRVGVTGLSGKSFRASNVEERLLGTAGTPEDIRHAAAVVADGVDANSDLHASEAYRKHLAVVYTARALREALANALSL